MRTIRPAAAAAMLMLCATTGTAGNSTVSDEGLLFSPESMVDVRFGNYVAGNEHTAAVSAPKTTIGGVQSAGAVFLVDRATGTITQRIESDFPWNSDRFGQYMEVDGNTLVIGNPYSYNPADNTYGEAYVYDLTTGNRLHRLVGDGMPYTKYASDIAIAGDVIAVGDERYGGPAGYGSGAVYLYDRITGAQLHQVIPSDLNAYDYFGGYLVLTETHLVVGVPRQDPNGVGNLGAVYVFDVATGAQLAKHIPPIQNSSTEFGRVMRVDGDLLVVDDRYGHPTLNNTGVIHCYSLSQGTLLSTIILPDARPNEYGVSAMELEDGLLAVGKSTRDGQTYDEGAAYVFDAATGTLLNQPQPPAPVVGARFGGAVLLDDGVLAISATGEGNNGVVRLFDASTGALLNEIAAPDASSVGFGIPGAMALDGDSLWIGAPSDDSPVYGIGSLRLHSVATGAELSRTQPDAGITGEGFGAAVAASYGDIVVGVPRSDLFGIDAGTAFVDGIRLVSPRSAPGERFGAAVAIESDVLVGSPFSASSTETGEANLFNDYPGAHIHTYAPADGAAGDQFGFAVANDGVVLIGAPGHAHSGLDDAGAVYAYSDSSFNSYELYAKFTAQDAAPGDGLGWSVSANYSYSIAGAPFADNAAGAAYVFDSYNGTQESKLTAPSPAPWDLFGYAVEIHGDYDLILVGAPGTQVNGHPAAGAVHIYQSSSGQYLGTLTAPNPAQGDNFGSSLQLVVNDNYEYFAIIGAPGRDETAQDSGAVFVFDLEDNSLAHTLAPATIEAGDAFGAAVAVGASDSWSSDSLFDMFIGAPNGDDAGLIEPNAGVVYTYELDADPSILIPEMTGSINVVGTSDVSYCPPGQPCSGGSGSSFSTGLVNLTSVTQTTDDSVTVIASASGSTDTGLVDGGASYAGGSGQVSINMISGFETATLTLSVNTSVSAFTGDDTTPVPCPEDTNTDNTIDLNDLLAILAAFGNAANPGDPLDIDTSGFVDLADVLAVLAVFSQDCPAPLVTTVDSSAGFSILEPTSVRFYLARDARVKSIDGSTQLLDGYTYVGDEWNDGWHHLDLSGGVATNNGSSSWNTSITIVFEPN